MKLVMYGTAVFGFLVAGTVTAQQTKERISGPKEGVAGPGTSVQQVSSQKVRFFDPFDLTAVRKSPGPDKLSPPPRGNLDGAASLGFEEVPPASGIVVGGMASPGTQAIHESLPINLRRLIAMILEIIRERVRSPLIPGPPFPPPPFPPSFPPGPPF